MMRQTIFGGLMIALLMLGGRATAQEAAVKAGSRVAIVGDSITEQKLYSKYMEAYLVACSGVPDVRVFQFGWSGETAAGFAARVENDLAAFQPTVVTLCYGMNDGGYRPFDENVGRNYETNMRNVLKKLNGLGIKTIVVGSPGAVDSDTFRPGQKMGDVPAHVAYNDNLAHLRDIDKTLAAEHKLLFANVHNAMYDTMGKAKAALGTKYDVCGGDGFHPGPNGQLCMAYAFLKGLGLKGDIGEVTIDASGSATASDGHKVVSSGKGSAEIESTRWPFCFDGAANSPQGTRSITPFLPFNQDLNRLMLKVTGLKGDKATVKWGVEEREFTREQLTAGVNLAAEFDKTPFDDAFGKFVGALSQKQGFETYMIKSVITTFRAYPPEMRDDAEVQGALKVLSTKLLSHQQRLEAESRKLLVPVKHTITVTQK